MVAGGGYYGDSYWVVRVFCEFALHLDWGPHAGRAAFVGRELQRVLSEVKLHVVVSHPQDAQQRFVVSQGGEECGEFFFVVSNLGENLYHVGDVFGSYGSPIDPIEWSWGWELGFR